MTEYIEKESLRGWTLIPPPTPSGKIIPRSVDKLPSKVLTSPPIKDPWNWCCISKPPENEMVILMCLCDRYDHPDTYTVCGWRLGRNWVVDNELCDDEVVAWQHLPCSLSVKQVREKIGGES